MTKKNMFDIMGSMKGGTLSSTPDICRLHATLFNVMVGNGLVGNWVCNGMVGCSIEHLFFRKFEHSRS